MKRCLFLAVAASLIATAGSGETPRAFGKPLQGLKPVLLQDVLAKPEAGRVVRLEGTIEKVCQNKGCWLELKQRTMAVHVTFENYGFFIPKVSIEATGVEIR